MKSTIGLQQTAVWLRLRSVRHEVGSSLVEYALLVTLIAVVCLLALNALGHTTSAEYTNVASSLAAARS